MEELQRHYDTALGLALAYGPRLLLALVTLVVGLWLINALVRGMERAMARKAFDVTLQRFLLSLSGIGLKVLLIISVLSMVGVATTSFIAIVGAAGLAVGLALQGNLQNFAGGVLILALRPFKVGDFIEAQGHLGTVHAIQVFHTVIKTPDNRTVVLPNGALSNGSLINYSLEETRRIDLVFGVGYGDDLKAAKLVLSRVVEAEGRVLKEPAPLVAVTELGDSAVNFTVRVWVKAADFFATQCDLREAVKTAFDREGISIPFPQRDVHLYQTAGLA